MKMGMYQNLNEDDGHNQIRKPTIKKKERKKIKFINRLIIFNVSLNSCQYIN